MFALASLTVLGLGCPQAPGGEDSEAAAAPTADAPDAPNGPVATVGAINGPGGLTSPDLAPGNFLGKGALLTAGQTVETPRGTLAELVLADGTKVRLNEGTALKVPTVKWPRRFELTRGEVVVIAAGPEDTQIAAGAEILTVASGEVQARNAGDERRYAVVSGAAQLKTPSKTIELHPGQSVDAPLPEDEYKDGPTLSLAALDDTTWTRTFASAAQMTEAVPRGVGSLTARRAGSNREQQRLRLTDQAVTVNITGRIAHTEIEQAFFNDQPQVLEGIYRFPLPGDASISGLGLLVGSRWMQGEVLEKQRARSIFSQIVDATVPRDPALLEWEQGNMFKLRVFPIPGRGERKVRLSYTQVLPVVAGKLRYRFPMGGSGAGGTPVDNFVFNVNIDRSELDSAQLAEIDTPMLTMNQSLDGDQVNLASTVKNFIPTSDLGVDIPLAAASRRVHAVSHLDKDGQAYFMLSLRPEFKTGSSTAPTNIAFVVDRSHSATPELWTLAQGIVAATASTLSPDDSFTVLACDTACSQLPGGFQSASASSIAETGEFLRDQDLAGASDLGAMMRAGSDALASTTSGERVIVYLGDGAPTSGALAPDELSSGLRGPMQGTRVLAVALGARADLVALGAVLNAAGGEIVRADPRDDIPELVRELSLRARVPMVSDLELDLPDGMLMVRQDSAAGVRTDDALLVTGKLSHPVSGEIRVRGRGPDGPVEASFPIDLSAARGDAATTVHKHLPRTWAAMQIGHLTKTKGFSAHDEIVRLSQDYTVLSRFTAMLVLENDAMFREFNVVRRATDKDRWAGTLPQEPTTEEADATAEVTTKLGKRSGLQPLGESGATKSEFKHDERSKDTGSARGRGAAPPPPTAAPGGFPSAEPTPEPEPDPSFNDAFDRRDDLKRAETRTPSEKGNRDPFGGEVDVAEDEDGDDFGPADGNLKAGSKMPASRPAPSSTSKPKAKPQKKRKKKSSGPWGNDPLGGVVGGGSSSGGWSAPPRRHWTPPTLRARTVSAPSARALARVDDLARQVAVNPTQRTAHGRLVRAAIRAGHPSATEFARAWAEVDPDHAPALLSLADMLAAAGDPTAARAYASAIEIRPFGKSQHESLAEGLTGKGDLARACSHRHAVVSIEPKTLRHHSALVRCLLQAGRADDARRARADAGRRAQGKASTLRSTFAALDAEIAGLAPAPEVKLHGSAQLKATVTWAGEDDLDIVVVDKSGRRLSALRPQGKVRVKSTRGSQSLTMRKVSKSVFIEVTRAGDGSGEDFSATRPLSGTLTLKTGGRTTRVPFEMRGGSIRLAKVFWSR